MSRPLNIEISDLAKAQIRSAEDWWRLNRPKAPNAIREEVSGVRRLHLARVRYNVYYRKALGASAREIEWFVMRQGLLPVAAGALIGAVAGLWTSQFLRHFLFEVSAFDPISFLAAPMLLLLVGVLSSWLPTRHALAIDPVSALRQQ